MSYDANYEQPTTPFTPFTPQETPINIQRDNANPPLFQGISVSNQSPTDDRFSVNSVIGHPSIICIQKTHDQFMKNFNEITSRNFEKKPRHSYILGQPPQPSSPNDAFSTTTLTPGILFGTDNN
jgi:hypothetical protein